MGWPEASQNILERAEKRAGGENLRADNKMIQASDVAHVTDALHKKCSRVTCGRRSPKGRPYSREKQQALRAPVDYKKPASHVCNTERVQLVGHRSRRFRACSTARMRQICHRRFLGGFSLCKRSPRHVFLGLVIFWKFRANFFLDRFLG